jgi:hypothetical protein
MVGLIAGLSWGKCGYMGLVEVELLATLSASTYYCFLAKSD